MRKTEPVTLTCDCCGAAYTDVSERAVLRGWMLEENDEQGEGVLRCRTDCREGPPSEAKAGGVS